MVEVQYRARRTILRHADTFTVSGNSRKGIFAMITPGRAKVYVPSSLVDSASRPIYLIIVPDDDTTVPTDTISWAGKTLTILKIIEERLRGELVFKMIIAHG
ncbi:MAG TPA: hypothetical protein VNK96_01935 [Fimbriimonadales bacterium]|nr:hypothetical protein [Fimbriimonadales bacterium]